MRLPPKRPSAASPQGALRPEDDLGAARRSPRAAAGGKGPVGLSPPKRPPAASPQGAARPWGGPADARTPPKRPPAAAPQGAPTAFIFDIDGTIIDSMPFHGKSWEAFFARRGVRYEGEAFLRATAGRTGVEIMRERFGPMSDEAAWALVHEKEDVYRELFRPVFREIGGFRAFARAARAEGVRIALATAGDAKNIAFAVSGLGMEREFDALAGAHDVRRGKPEPDLFLLAAERMGADPAECIVFEDAPLGIEGARRAGMHAVGVTSGETAERLAGPHVLAAIPHYRGLAPRAIIELALNRTPRAAAREGAD